MDQTKLIQNSSGVQYSLDLSCMLGSGQFGKVYRAKCRTPGREQEEFAIKIVTKADLLTKEEPQRSKQLERLKQEVETWKKSSHPNIVKFHEFIETANSCYFVSEYCEGQTLQKALELGGRIPEADALNILKGLASAVSYLHSNHIIHRDIKPANIIFKGNVAKLVDFGFAKQYNEGQQQTIGIGTPKYMAPELLEYKDDYSGKVDIWALGWTYFEMLYKTDPFPLQLCKGFDDLLNAIIGNEIKFPKNVNVSQKSKDLIISMLQVEEEDRDDHLQLLNKLK